MDKGFLTLQKYFGDAKIKGMLVCWLSNPTVSLHYQITTTIADLSAKRNNNYCFSHSYGLNSRLRLSPA